MKKGLYCEWCGVNFLYGDHVFNFFDTKAVIKNTIYHQVCWDENNKQIQENVMENQHDLIKGYRDLSQEEIDSMNRVKSMSEEVGRLIKQLKDTNGLDQRWIAIGSTQLQQGFMAVIRGIAQPTTY